MEGHVFVPSLMRVASRVRKGFRTRQGIQALRFGEMFVNWSSQRGAVMKKLALLCTLVISLSGCAHMAPPSFSGSHDATPALTAKELDSGSSGFHFGTGAHHPAPTATRRMAGPLPLQDSDNDGVYDGRDDCPSTPGEVAVDSLGCPIPLFVKTNLTFASNEVAVDPVSQDRVSRLGYLLQQNPNSMAVIEGHTDNVGDDETNIKLSQIRADSIKQRLMQQYNIAPERIKTMGYGKSRPLVSNETESGRSRNRRVEFTVTGYYRSETSYVALHRPYNIHYEPYQVDISGQFKDKVDDLGRYLSQHQGTKALIDGYTDNSGDPGTNLLLSQKRVDAVKQYLLEHFAIDEQRIVAIGHGEHSPIANNETEQGRNINRRVTITVRRAYHPVPPVADDARFSGRLAGNGRLDSIRYSPLSRQITIRFSAENIDIEADGVQAINELGMLLQKKPDVKVTIEGYTQSQGPQGQDVQISRQRAETVKRYLQHHYDIAPERLRAIGYGADSPLAAAGQAENSVHIKFDHF